MGLLGFASGAIQAAGFDDIVSGFLGDFGLDGFISDIAGGAITNAAVAAIADGDIGQAAIFGAAGGATGGLGFDFADTVGAGVSGYGLDKATGGSGITGLLSGAAGQYLNETYKDRQGAKAETSSGGSPGEPAAPSVGGGGDTGGASGSSGGGSTITNTLQNLGLVDDKGQGTLLGKALVSGIGSMAQEASMEDLLDKKQQQAKERDTHQANLEHEQEQKRIAAFNGPQQYQIVRS